MKAIGIIRTSTERQEIESQKQELISYMLRDGIKEEDIIIIGEKGASAIKLDTAYIKNMNEVYKLIDTGNISIIYSFALDRIGRDEAFLVNFKNTCIAKRVQLKTINPYMFLLNDDGSVNAGMEMLFSIHIIHAKQEMNDKKSRFSRGKKRNDENGKYNGGFIPYGYLVNDDGYIVENTEESKVVKLVFNLYATEKYSTSTLAKELSERGYSITLRHVRSMLSQKAYIGIHSHIKYPQIIDKEVFDKCNSIKKANNHNQTTQTKHWSVCAKLIKCSSCGNNYAVHRRSYRCSAKVNHYKPCDSTLTISKDHIEKFIEKLAYDNESMWMQVDRVKSIQEIDENKVVISDKIANLKEELEKKISKKAERVKELYIDGEIDKNEYKSRLSKISTLENDTTEKIVYYENKLIELNNRIDYLNNPLNHYNPQSATPKDKYDMVHRNIKEIHLKKDTVKKGVFVEVVTTEGIVSNFKFYSQRKPKWYVIGVNGEEIATEY